MSLLNFPPPVASGAPFALQEFNGQILFGTREQFDLLQKSPFLSDYPILERSTLSKLQHSLSRDDVKSAFAKRESRSQLDPLRDIANSRVNIEGGDEDSGSLARAMSRVRNGLGGVLSKMVMASSDDPVSLAAYLDKYSSTTNWSRTWLRCIATAKDGSRMAVCQATDYVRVYTLGVESIQPPVTLHHAQMKSVAAMQFDPCDCRILAVAASTRVFVWRMTGKIANSKPTGLCTRVVDTCIGPLSSLSWDTAWSNSLIVASCTSSKIILLDVSIPEQRTLGAWMGGSVTGLYPSPDGGRIAVTYTANVLRIYERSSWKDEKWTGLAGRATGVVWAPNGEFVLFGTEEGSSLFSLSFTPKSIANEEGVRQTSWTGSTRATPIFDLSPIVFDPIEGASEQQLENDNVRSVMRLGGSVKSVALSPDGERLAIVFADQEASKCIAIFIVDWLNSVRVIPCGFVESSFMGIPDIVQFIPAFNAGSLLSISWSSGSMQLIPLIYGRTAAAASLSLQPLISGTHGCGTITEETSLGWQDSSLASVELSSRFMIKEGSPICYSQMLKEKSMAGDATS